MPTYAYTHRLSFQWTWIQHRNTRRVFPTQLLRTAIEDHTLGGRLQFILEFCDAGGGGIISESSANGKRRETNRWASPCHHEWMRNLISW